MQQSWVCAEYKLLLNMIIINVEMIAFSQADPTLHFNSFFSLLFLPFFY